MAALSGGVIAVLALLPAAANPSLMVTSRTLAASLCTSGARAVVEIPIGDPIMPGTLSSACCVKGCKRGEGRKKPRSADDPRPDDLGADA